MKRWEAKKSSPEKGHVDVNWKHWIRKMGMPAKKPNNAQVTKSSKL
jgi:hypothetical protein